MPFASDLELTADAEGLPAEIAAATDVENYSLANALRTQLALAVEADMRNVNLACDRVVALEARGFRGFRPRGEMLAECRAGARRAQFHYFVCRGATPNRLHFAHGGLVCPATSRPPSGNIYSDDDLALTARRILLTGFAAPAAAFGWRPVHEQATAAFTLPVGSYVVTFRGEVWSQAATAAFRLYLDATPTGAAHSGVTGSFFSTTDAVTVSGVPRALSLRNTSAFDARCEGMIKVVPA
jgi:hypothetical protein